MLAHSAINALTEERAERVSHQQITSSAGRRALLGATLEARGELGEGRVEVGQRAAEQAEQRPGKLLIALSLGLRRGEVLGLRWKDIDFERATLRVTGLLQRVRGKFERVSTKTASSARGVDLPPVLLAQLRKRRAAQEQEREEAGEAWQENGLVFTIRLGTPIEPRNLIRHFKQVLNKAGCRRRSASTTCATPAPPC